MAKNKSKPRWDRFLIKSEYEWAEKRGKNFPLNFADQMQMNKEKFIEMRYQQSKDLFSKDNKFNVSSKDEVCKGFSFKFLPFMIHEGNVIQDERFTFMTTEDMEVTLDAVEYSIRRAERSKEDYASISLLTKYQRYNGEFCDQDNCFTKAAIMISPSSQLTGYLNIRDEDEIIASLYAGLIYDEYDPPETQNRGILEIFDKNLRRHVVELEEFYVLAETKDKKEHTFTFFNRREDILFTVIIPDLNDVDFIADNEKIEVLKRLTGKMK